MSAWLDVDTDVDDDALDDEPVHVNYPHHPGYLYDCYACEYGPCVCQHDVVHLAPCVSTSCVQSDDDESVK